MSIPLNKASIVVSATDPESLEKITTLSGQTPWDIVEIRVDRIQTQPQLSIEISSIPCPVILTCRHPDEGGFNELRDPEQRGATLKPLIAHAAAIDIEIAYAAQMAETINLARASNLSLILSFHDFSTTPDETKLQAIVNEGITHCADLIKSATTTDNPEQLCRLLSLFSTFPDQPLALMGMGKLGMASRLIAAQSGSLLNYAAINEENVPGQWPVGEFRDLIDRTAIGR